MNLKETYKKLDDWLIKKTDKINLRKKFPNYFNIYIFRIFYTVMFLILMFDFILNGYAFSSYSISCPENSVGGFCWNPIYYCSILNYSMTNEPLSIRDNSARNPYDCKLEISDSYCPDNVCNKLYIAAGESYGRDDFLANNGIMLILGLWFLTFLINHVWFVLFRKADGRNNG